MLSSKAIKFTKLFRVTHLTISRSIQNLFACYFNKLLDVLFFYLPARSTFNWQKQILFNYFHVILHETKLCGFLPWFLTGISFILFLKLKQRIRQHKSDVFHPQNSFSKKCSEHLRNCSRMKEPFFRIYRSSYENKKGTTQV